jgi:hypothetical protein
MVGRSCPMVGLACPMVGRGCPTVGRGCPIVGRSLNLLHDPDLVLSHIYDDPYLLVP